MDELLEVLCDHRIHTMLNEKFYKTAIRLAILYVKKQHVYKISVIEMRLLGWISGNTSKDRIQNEEIH